MERKVKTYASDFDQLLAEVFEPGICVQCATCVGSCPVNCLEMAGENPFPALRSDGECIDCGLCLEVCPRRGTAFDEISREFFGRAPTEREIAGVVDRYLVGHAVDEEVWRGAAGGGIISGLLIHLLESGKVDGAIVCGPDPNKPGAVIPKVITSREEMMVNAGSHYRLVPINAILQELVQTGDQRFALVGSGCHISGLRKLQMAKPKWRSKIVMTIGIMCGMNLSPLWASHLMVDMGIEDPSTVQDFKYRGWGSAGAEATLKSGERVELKQYFGFQMIRLAPCYMPEGCSLCLDLYAEHADIAVGDYEKGISIAFVRSPEARAALESAVEQGELDLSPVEAEAVERHRVMYDLKLKRALTLLEGRRKDGLIVPNYGERERSPDPLWDNVEDKGVFLFVRRAIREPSVQAWFKELPYWRQFRIGKLYMACEPRRQWPGGSERSQTFIDREGWEAFLARRKDL